MAQILRYTECPLIVQIRQFIKTINGMNCLRLDYQTIYKHVVAGPRSLIMDVLEPIDGAD